MFDRVERRSDRESTLLPGAERVAHHRAVFGNPAPPVFVRQIVHPVKIELRPDIKIAPHVKAHTNSEVQLEMVGALQELALCLAGIIGHAALAGHVKLDIRAAQTALKFRHYS
jgi:hypothetical protein